MSITITIAIVFMSNALSTAICLGLFCWIMKTKDKDYTVCVRTHILGYNAFLGISNIALSLYGINSEATDLNDSWIAVLVISLNFYPQFLNSIFMYYISWSLYTVVTRENTDIIRDLKKSAMYIHTASAVLSATIFVSLFYKEIMVYQFEYIVLLVIPSSVILFCILFYYFKVRSSLKLEFQSNNLKNTSKRLMAKRLAAYPFLYSFVSISSIISFVYALVLGKGFIFQVIAGTITNGLFIFFSSALYLSSFCSSRSMLSICLKKSVHDDEKIYKSYLQVSYINDPGYFIELISSQK